MKMITMRIIKSMQARMMRTMVTRRTRKQRMARLPIFMLDAFTGNNSNGFQSQCAALVHILIKVRRFFLTLQASPPSFTGNF